MMRSFHYMYKKEHGTTLQTRIITRRLPRLSLIAEAESEFTIAEIRNAGVKPLIN
jgi:hypothetical protein